MTDRYAVIGYPVAHSKSPRIHTSFARDTGQDMEYVAIECEADGFVAAVARFRADGGCGMNVTAPFKLQAFDLATERSERAVSAGAVNTLRFDDTDVRADNFDGVGLVHDLERNLGIKIAGTRILILGAGGAARGILRPLAEQRPAELVLANRTPERAHAVAATVPDGAVRAGGYQIVGEGGFDLVINATSASMARRLPPIDPKVFAPGGTAYDLAYGIGLTPFLALARSAGVTRLVDGVGMLVEQAAEAFAWWRGVRPDTRSIINELTIPLTEPEEDR